MDLVIKKKVFDRNCKAAWFQDIKETKLTITIRQPGFKFLNTLIIINSNNFKKINNHFLCLITNPKL